MADNINATASLPPQAQLQAQQAVERKPVRQDVESAQAAEAARQAAEVSVEDLQAAIDQLNEFMKQGQRALSFSVDSSAEEVVVQVTDKETQELIRQIPSPEALKLKQHLEGVIGLLFNSKA